MNHGKYKHDPQNHRFYRCGQYGHQHPCGLLENGWPKERILATTRTRASLDKVHSKFGIQVTTDNHAAVRNAEIVILSVKPQMMKPVMEDLTPALEASRPLLISVAAGVTLDSLQNWSGPDFPIVRSMPNTPCLLRCGVTGLYANSLVTPGQKTDTDTIFKAIGIVQWVETESMIDTIIAVSGSGPAYYFLFMEAMTAMGVKLGWIRKPLDA